MRAKRLILVVHASLLAASLLLGGCGQSITGTSGDVSDEMTIRELINNDDWFLESEAYIGTGGGFGQPGDRGEIDPLDFWREVDRRQVDVRVSLDPDLGKADVKVERQIWGRLCIVDEDMNLYEKPMHHTGVRYATFRRITEDSRNLEPSHPAWYRRWNHRRRHWLLTQISGVVSQSEHLTVSIDWIKIEGASVDAVITDPLALLDVPDDIMAFEVGEEITVTVQGPAEDALLFMHVPGSRMPLTYQNGVGTFSGTWTIETDHAGCRNIWVEAIEHDSIFDSEYPDDVLIWGMPYAVAD
jgi:hypothetical protein